MSVAEESRGQSMTKRKSRDYKEIVRRGYDKVSFVYRSDLTPDDYGEYATWVGLLTARLPKGRRVLDLGCGCGLPATRLLAQHFDVTGIDFSEVQIARASRLVASARFVSADISEVSFPPETYDAVVSFYAIIHMPLEEHARLFRRIVGWLKPAGYLLAIVGHDAWTGTDERYLNVEGGRMCWSHADEATNLRWMREARLRIHWTRFVPEGDGGHTLVFAQKPPIAEECTRVEPPKV